ncbi:Putative cytochrome c biogenesis factor, archaeal [Methanosarcina sp. MTP4]|uniref:cytochrome c-type biogenesis CcmF C-terminal domain-containing protein n=1 Tax=Methanosarcina sp. MTP4 TaxID=1434100 RepID=UPI00061568F3|nr:cytochrome c-type biogenesis CcmF C-terminal domain-containing protein [Methanosarcina sp. MTP4]AKB24623.1 Putative cytochrome c biogenesis factor, archaeal [Methanosarcina sp. MTP4]
MKKIDEILTVRSTMFAAISVLVLLAAIVTMGLLTPFLVKVTSGEGILLEAAYFNARTALPTLALVLVLAFCLMLGSAGRKEGLVVVGLGVLGSIVSAVLSPFSSMPINVAFPILSAALFAVVYKLLSSRGSNFSEKLRRTGSHIIHLGAILLLVGIVFSTNLNLEDSAIISLDEVSTFESMGYSIRITDFSSGMEGEPYGGYAGSAYVSTIDFDVYKWGRFFEHGQVKYIRDFKWGQSYTETYIHRGLLEELFIAPKSVDSKTQTVDLYVRKVPFMTFLWGGFYIMVLGIVLVFVSGSLSSGNRVSGNEGQAKMTKMTKNQNKAKSEMRRK